MLNTAAATIKMLMQKRSKRVYTDVYPLQSKRLIDNSFVNSMTIRRNINASAMQIACAYLDRVMPALRPCRPLCNSQGRVGRYGSSVGMHVLSDVETAAGIDACV